MKIEGSLGKIANDARTARFGNPFSSEMSGALFKMIPDFA
jgi:hypothetical protein